ncbi:MAG: hypothetical protein AAF791_08990 [Bacteroidota bacterium]
MTRFLILPLLALTLVACRTETADGATEADTAAAADASAEDAPSAQISSGGLPYVEPQRADNAEQTTRTAMLKEVVADGEECFVMASDAEGDLLLMGTSEACEQGATLGGRAVTLTQEAATLDVPIGEETSQQEVQLVVGIEAAE